LSVIDREEDLLRKGRNEVVRFHIPWNAISVGLK
jgi:hypothetical protein